MLSLQPHKRPTAAEALGDKWFLTASCSQTLNLESFENLKKFRADSKLQQAVLSFITSQLVKKEDTKLLTQTFSALDVNGDGKLSREELLTGYSELMGPQQAEAEVERIMREVDVDSNGFIEYSEFVMATMNRENLLSKENLDNAFCMFDSDGSGTISAEELKKILGGDVVAAEGVWAELIRTVDQNGDGEIDFKEFKEMMLRNF